MRLASLAAVAALAAGAVLPAAASADAPVRTSCFSTTSWQGWTAAKNGDALYLKVRSNEVYRVDLTPGSHARRGPGDFLVNQVHGSNWICSALDLNLSISDDMGFRRPLIATNLRRLSPAEIAALPKSERP
jgi:hypothetical protein